MLKVRIEKIQSVRTGNWEMWPLDAAQQQYAALDAYAALLLYKASTPVSGSTLLLLKVPPHMIEYLILMQQCHHLQYCGTPEGCLNYADLAYPISCLMCFFACSISWQCPSLLGSGLC